MAKPWIVLEAPLATTPASDGTRGFAAAILRSGLRARIGAQNDAAGTELDEHSLEEGVRHHIEAGACPIVVGGDCCVALAARALRGRGRPALAYIDGHTDFKHFGNLEPQPATARAEAATLLGRGGTDAVFLDDDTALIGFRRDDPAFLELRATKILLWPMFWLYEHSRQELDQSLLRRFDRPELDGIWIHLDVDALEPALISAVPHEIHDGLAPPELTAMLSLLIGTGKVCGMSVANLSADQDTDGRQVAIIADILAEALGA